MKFSCLSQDDTLSMHYESYSVQSERESQTSENCRFRYFVCFKVNNFVIGLDAVFCAISAKKSNLMVVFSA